MAFMSIKLLYLESTQIKVLKLHPVLLHEPIIHNACGNCRFVQYLE